MSSREDLVALVFDGPPTEDGQPGPRLLRVEDADGNELKAFGAWGRDDKHPDYWTFILSAGEIHHAAHQDELGDGEASEAAFKKATEPEHLEKQAREGLANGLYMIANSRMWEPGEYVIEMRRMLEERIGQCETDRAALVEKRTKLKAIIPMPVEDGVDNLFQPVYDRGLESLDNQVRHIDVWLATFRRGLELLEGYRDQPPLVQH